MKKILKGFVKVAAITVIAFWMLIVLVGILVEAQRGTLSGGQP